MDNSNLYVIKTKPGRERRALQDIMDIIFTYDMNAEPINPKLTGLVLIKTKLSYEDICKIIKEYPIRTVLSIERTIKGLEISGKDGLIKGIDSLLKELTKDRVLVRKIEVKCLGEWKYLDNEVKKLVNNFLTKYELRNGIIGKDLMLNIVNKYIFIKTIE